MLFPIHDPEYRGMLPELVQSSQLSLTYGIMAAKCSFFFQNGTKDIQRLLSMHI